MVRGTLCFFLNDTATPEIYPLSLHDALPISGGERCCGHERQPVTPMPVSPMLVDDLGASPRATTNTRVTTPLDRKSTRLNSSHANISYAVFCLQKKNIYHVLIVRIKKTHNHS